jgi:KDO2-lipid IV(A) lauroyltransferase
MTNLRNSFPEKSEKELLKIARQYYRNIADVFMEVIKLQNISSDKLLQRFTFENIEVFRNLFKENRSIIVTIGHCGNWEWMGTALGLITEQKGYAVVKPLSNMQFNNYMTMLRTKLNKDSVIPFKETYRTLVRNKNRLTFNVFASDQTPTKDEINFWTIFMNQETPFFLGIEKIASTLEMGVIFVDIQRKGRGIYNCKMHLITENAKDTETYEITKKYVSLLEESIRNAPDNWLWSHRRWKHKREAGDELK